MKQSLLAFLLGAAVLPSASADANSMTADQLCNACRYTYDAIEAEMVDQTAVNKGKKLPEQKAAVREILLSVCDGPAFQNIALTPKHSYVQVDLEGDTAGLDTAEEHGRILGATCARLVVKNEDKLVTNLADFRKDRRRDVRNKLCSKWTDSCSYDEYKAPRKKKTKKPKRTAADKCLLDAYSLATSGDFEGSLEKVACAVVEMPEEATPAQDDEENMDPPPPPTDDDADGNASDGNDDDQDDDSASRDSRSEGDVGITIEDAE